MTIYKFFLKKEKHATLYAFTNSKVLSKLFKQQRDMKVFLFTKTHISKEEYNEYQKNNCLNELVSISLNDEKENEFSIVGTNKEENDLTEVYSKIYFKLWYIKQTIDNKLNQKYTDLITTNLIHKDHSISNHNNYCNISSYKLFYHMYDYTFNSKQKYKTVDDVINRLHLNY